MRRGGEFLEDFVWGGRQERNAGWREGIGVGVDDRAEGDGVALHEVAGAEVSVGRVADHLADLRRSFAVVGERTEGCRGRVWDHRFQRLRDLAVELGVIGECATRAEKCQFVEHGGEADDGSEARILKNPPSLLRAHAARGEERVVVVGIGVLQSSLDDRFGGMVGSPILAARRSLAEALKYGFANPGVTMTGQLEKDVERRALPFGVSDEETRLEAMRVEPVISGREEPRLIGYAFL